jgi:hypothetical protein
MRPRLRRCPLPLLRRPFPAGGSPVQRTSAATRANSSREACDRSAQPLGVAVERSPVCLPQRLHRCVSEHLAPFPSPAVSHCERCPAERVPPGDARGKDRGRARSVGSKDHARDSHPNAASRRGRGRLETQLSVMAQSARPRRSACCGQLLVWQQRRGDRALRPEAARKRLWIGLGCIHDAGTRLAAHHRPVLTKASVNQIREHGRTAR